MYGLYSALLAALLVAGFPYWIFQMARHGKYRAGFGERLGRVPARILVGGDRPAIWVHAVSVGEVLAVAGLVANLREKFPGHHVVVSTTTATGQNLARARFGEQNVFYFPLDFGFCVQPYLRTLRPELVVLAETEFWPNFLRLARVGGAKIAVVNARISDRSLPGYWRFRRWLRPVLDNISLFLTQTQEDAGRLIQVGAVAERVRVSGNLKFDVPPPAETVFVAQLRDGLHLAGGAGPVLVCGSTMEGEEPLLMRGFENVLASHPKAVMVLAPRHPERFDKVAVLLQQLGTKYWRRSEWRGEPVAGGVLLLDSIGELASAYSLADLAFVGGSLVAHGGHNILEAAQFGVATVIGTSYENFRDIVALFQHNQAVRIVGAAELPLVFMELVDSPEQRKAQGQRASETLRQQMGATERTLQALVELMSSGRQDSH
jgi:3-deoxy-D-manno-octulosonic-acid transferase